MARLAGRSPFGPCRNDARKRLAYDEIFANQLALLVLRQVSRRKRGVAARRATAA